MSGFPDLFYMNFICNSTQLSSLALEVIFFFLSQKKKKKKKKTKKKTTLYRGGRFLSGTAH